MRALRIFLLVEGLAFLAAALTHSGVLMRGYEHGQASIAETVIAAVLFLGLTLTAMRPAMTRTFALIAQVFALFGTLVGIFTIVAGIGPRTVGDLAYHLIIIAFLTWGIVAAARSS